MATSGSDEDLPSLPSTPSSDEEVSIEQLLKCPVSISIKERSLQGDDYVDRVVQPSEMRFRIVLAAISNALTSLCSPPGHAALTNVAKKICDEASISYDLSGEMERIRNCEGIDAAHDFVIEFRKRLFEEFPAVWINEQATEAHAMGVTQAQARPSHWTGDLRRDCSLHLSPWMIDNAINAANAGDLDQFRNNLFRLQCCLAHEVGGHVLRFALLGWRNCREITPIGVSTGLEDIELFAWIMKESGLCLEELMFGGIPTDLVDSLDNTGSYVPFKPCIYTRRADDPEYAYINEVKRSCVRNAVKQGFMRSTNVIPLKLGAAVYKIARPSSPHEPGPGKGRRKTEVFDLFDVVTPQRCRGGKSLDYAPRMGETEHIVHNVIINCKEIREVSILPNKELPEWPTSSWPMNPTRDEDTAAEGSARHSCLSVVVQSRPDMEAIGE